MNLSEFAKLKLGDKIINPMLSTSTVGTVAKVDDSGVYVKWGDNPAQDRTHHFPVNSTGWMHWMMADAVEAEGLTMATRDLSFP